MPELSLGVVCAAPIEDSKSPEQRNAYVSIVLH